MQWDDVVLAVIERACARLIDVVYNGKPPLRSALRRRSRVKIEESISGRWSNPQPDPVHSPELCQLSLVDLRPTLAQRMTLRERYGCEFQGQKPASCDRRDRALARTELSALYQSAMKKDQRGLLSAL
jgi:hypothetical protein